MDQAKGLQEFLAEGKAEGKEAEIFCTRSQYRDCRVSGEFTAFVRSSLPSYSQPDADAIENLSTPIIVDQKRLGGSSRSTMGTITDIYAILRPLLRSLFISPSFDALAGMGGDVWTGNLDYQLLRPLDIQFVASFRHWRSFALIDLAVSVGVIVAAVWQMPSTLTPAQTVSFVGAMLVALLVMDSVLHPFLHMPNTTTD